GKGGAAKNPPPPGGPPPANWPPLPAPPPIYTGPPKPGPTVGGPWYPVYFPGVWGSVYYRKYKGMWFPVDPGTGNIYVQATRPAITFPSILTPVPDLVQPPYVFRPLGQLPKASPPPRSSRFF